MKLIASLPAVFWTTIQQAKPRTAEGPLILTPHIHKMWKYMYRANNVADEGQPAEWMHHQTAFMADLRAATQSTLGLLDQIVGTA